MSDFDHDFAQKYTFLFNCGFSSAKLRSWGRFHYFVRVFASPVDGYKRLPFFNKNFNDTKDTGEYHKTYTEDIFKWDGGYSYGHRDDLWDDWDDVCSCANPEPVMDYGDCYCDVCYGTIDKENQIDKLNNKYYE